MNASDIRHNCIKSCETYLKFLNDKGKGLEEIDIAEKTQQNTIVKLRLSKKLFNIDLISIKDLRNDKIYDNEEIRIIEYDSDSNILLVRPNKKIERDFYALLPRDLKIISDLKFLIENVKKWYEQNGTRISLPTLFSPIRDSFETMVFMDTLLPSENQKDCIKNIFENSFSYIWGAPGTGKTQFVLSYAGLEYIKNDLRIAIIAPTNNALEQTLRGVIKMTDKSGIKRDKILRLGYPTRKFAEDFPEVCEERGVLNAIKETEGRIDRINRVINYSESLEKINELDKKFNDIEQIEILKELRISINDKLEDANLELKKIENKIYAEEKDVDKRIKSLQKLEKKKKSILTKIKGRISKANERLDSDIETEKIAITKHNENLVILKLNSEKVNENVKALKNEFKNVDEDANDFLKDLIPIINRIKKLSSIKKSLTLETFEKIKNEIIEFIEEEKERLSIDENFYEEHKHLTREQIDQKIKQFEDEKEKLLKSSPDSRMENVNLIACTLDGYIGRFKDKSLNVDHIFLDEAGYANLIKGLTLFAINVPITFLGDHMQLPPICEIGDREIQNQREFFEMYLWAQSALYIESLFSKTSDEMREQYLKDDSPEFNLMKRNSLTATYRFGQNLSDILDRKVYRIGLTSSSENNHTLIRSVHGKKFEGLKSRESINEVNEIVKIIQGINTNDFIILTPYKKQVKLLGKHLPRERNNLQILTVHGSQGREWDTVILSVVDTNDKWFVDSENKMSKGLKLLNTAVSRARKELIIVCDTNYWKNQNQQLISNLISIN